MIYIMIYLIYLTWVNLDHDPSDLSVLDDLDHDLSDLSVLADLDHDLSDLSVQDDLGHDLSALSVLDDLGNDLSIYRSQMIQIVIYLIYLTWVNLDHDLSVLRAHNFRSEVPKK